MKTGLKVASHLWSYHIVMLLIAVFFLSGMGGAWYTLLINALLVAGMAMMAFNEGAYHGEKGCTLAASLEKQAKEGRRIDDALKAQVFNRKVAAWILIFGAAPFLLLSTVNAAVAPFYPEIPAIEEQAEEEEKSFSFALDEEEVDVVVNPVNVAARAVFMPYVSVYTLVSGSVLNALFFLFSLPLPVACAVGYLLGPKLRDKKLHDIAKGKKRKMRNLKVNKKPRTPKAEV